MSTERRPEDERKPAGVSQPSQVGAPHVREDDGGGARADLAAQCPCSGCADSTFSGQRS